MILVIDYGMGNLRSVVKALEKYTDKVKLSKDPSDIKRSKALVMPGDGAFKMAMENLKDQGWIEPLKDHIGKDKYFLGICLGYQLLFSSSEEFEYHEGLNIIPGKVKRFRLKDLKVPHMGWNEVELKRDSKFMYGIKDKSYFYFIHSYYPEIEDDSWTLGEVTYGIKFPCVVGKGNMIAAQFHPEKSHKTGLKIIENFVRNICL